MIDAFKAIAPVALWMFGVFLGICGLVVLSWDTQLVFLLLAIVPFFLVLGHTVVDIACGVGRL